MTIALETLLSSPDLLALKLDLDRERIWFVPLSADEYHAFAFLDERMQRRSTGAYLINLPGLSEHLSSRPLPRPVHYIFHGAHCCSTLLARCLEHLDCFVLKEPYLLTQIAILRDCPAARPMDWHNRVAAELPGWLNMATLLLSRTYGTRKSVVIKTNDLCNGLGRELLARDSRSKIIFLQSPLKTFLLSVLKQQGRRAWTRERLNILARPLAAMPELVPIEIVDLSDAEAAAALWLFNCSLCRDLLTGPESGRVLPLDGEAVAERPLATVSLAAKFFELEFPEDWAARHSVDLESNRHAKDLSKSYGADTRKRERAEAEAQFGAEAELGIEWAMRAAPKLTAQGPFPLR